MPLLNPPLCDFGWKAPEFTLKDAQGKAFTMSEQMGENGLLIMFVCNHCPYVKAVADRLVEDTAELKALGINSLAIMSNDYATHPDDSPENMIKFAQQYGWEFPYLVDEDQTVAKAYDAVCTPDFFGFNNRGELQYRGRLDDARLEGAADRQRNLVDAMLQVAKTGKGPQQQFASAGCSIKWRAA